MKKDKESALTLPCLQVDEVTCRDCKYFGQAYCSNVALNDALAYAKKLEEDWWALLKIAHDYAGCSECVHVDNNPEQPPCNGCGALGVNWVWRGVQPKEEDHENA